MRDRRTKLAGKWLLSSAARTCGLRAASLAPRIAPRRPGDPARVVAAVDRIREEIGWVARFGLSEVVASAWDAYRRS